MAADESPSAAAPAWTFPRLLVVVAAALVSLVAIDLVAARVAPPIVRREVDDGIADLVRKKPTTLVLGSSNARSLELFADAVEADTRGQERIAIVPVEWGRVTAYDWVLRHRVIPALDAHRLQPRRFLIVVTWFDSTDPEEGIPGKNIPARGWQWRHFFADLFTNGLGSFGKGYLTHRWERLFRSSALVHNRSHPVVLSALTAVLDKHQAERVAASDASRLPGWQEAMVAGSARMMTRPQMDALRRIIAWAKGRGMEISIGLFPLKPATITEAAREQTLRPFAAAMKRLADETGARFIDMTEGTSVLDEHFQADFDHLTPAGNQAFSDWLFTHDLAFLRAPVGSAP